MNLNGNNAFIEDSTALGSNSALTGLANVAGALVADDGASVSTTGALDQQRMASISTPIRLGRFDPSVAGALTNSGSSTHRQHPPLGRTS